MSGFTPSPVTRFAGVRAGARIAALHLLLAAAGGARTATAQGIVVPSTPTQAQSAAAALGRPASNADIAKALRESGLSIDQVKQRLRTAGYDPSLADPFFGGATTRDSTATQQYTSAFRSIGLLPATVVRVVTPEDSVGAVGQRALAPEPPPSRVFGKDVFRRSSTAFDPVAAGPVDASYRIGATDQLQLVLLGDVELAYQLDVRPDGTILIPQVGQVAVSGLTLDGARAMLRQRASRSYSGLVVGSTQLDLTVSRVRTNAVFVIGEVENPGIHQVSALGSAFHAIARAGGPTERGSFRTIEVRRAGTVIKKIDLYRYLLNGDASQDLRVEQGDVIFVPLSARQVGIEGSIRRSLEFELLPSENLLDLVTFAGGLTANANVDRLQVDRILPPDQRSPGFDRVKIDVRADGRLERLRSFALKEGDVVTVFRVGELRRNTLRIGGAVYQPGEFQFKEGLTLDSLITAAQGLEPYARRDRVVVRRLVRSTGLLRNITVASEPGGSFGGFPLEEFDQVEALDARVDFPKAEVTVSGAVNRSGTFPYLVGETLRDLVERAGGLREGADLIEVARRRRFDRFSDSTSAVIQFSVAQLAVAGTAAAFRLEPADAIEIRLSPGFRQQRFVQVEGAFINTGTFVITENVDRLSTVIARAGGLQPGAYGASLQLLRGGIPVSVDFDGVRKNDADFDLLVRDGDVLKVSVDSRTVRVDGGVLRPSLIRFDPTLSVSDYIDRAGGPSERARISAVVVTSANGLSKRSKRRFGVLVRHPDVLSGSTIFVPEKAPITNTNDPLTKIFQMTSAIASLVIAYAAAVR